MATRKNRKNTRGGLFGIRLQDKTEADNVKDFDNRWLGHIDPQTRKEYEYDANTYWPGKTNPGMRPKSGQWKDRKTVWRTFATFDDRPEGFARIVVLTATAKTYIGQMRGIRSSDGVQTIHLVDVYIPEQRMTIPVLDVQLHRGDRWRYKGVLTTEPEPHPAPPQTIVPDDRMYANKVLQINPRSPGEDDDAYNTRAKKAFRKLALEYHPDKNKDPNTASTMQKLNEARTVLGFGGSRRAKRTKRVKP